jgi:predicted RNase H-like HicB family nuclease
MDYTFTVLFTQDNLTGMWTASVIESIGILAQGRTIDEARDNVSEAFRQAVLSRRKYKSGIIGGYNTVRIEKITVHVEGEITHDVS